MYLKRPAFYRHASCRQYLIGAYLTGVHLRGPLYLRALLELCPRLSRNRRTSLAYTARTPAVPLKGYSQCSTAPSVRPYSDDFAVQLTVYGKLLPSQPASVYHGGPWLYLLHRPEPPYACRDYRPSRPRLPRRTLTLPAPPTPPSRAPRRLPGLSTVPPRLTIYPNRVGLEPSFPLTRLPST